MRHNLLLLFGLLSAGFSHAVNFDSTYLRDGTYFFDDTVKIMRSQLFTTYKSQFGLTTNDVMQLQQAQDADNTAPMKVGNGHFYTRYVQVHKGYEIEGSQMNVMGQHDVVLRANGFIVKNANINVSNPISESAALSIALNATGASTFVWQDPQLEAALKEMREDQAATYYPKGKLKIRKIGGQQGTYKLCWTFNIRALTPLASHVVIVDAISGAVLSQPSPYYGADWRWGDVDTWYDGLQSIQTSTCALCTNYTLAGPVARRSYAWWRDGSTYKPAKDNDNHWTSSEGTRTVATAYWIADKVRDYYSYEHGRWGSDYAGKVVSIRGNIVSADLANAGYSYEVDDEDEISIRPDYSNPVGAIDVIAHELAHGYIKYHCNIGIDPGDYDANAIREGLADIMGLLVERSVNGSTDWTFGEDVGVYTRHFANPHADWPTASAASYLEPGYWAGTGGSGYYSNSGILRKWFHRLSTRTSWPAGVGIDAADELVYVTMSWWIWGNLRWPEFASQSKAEAETNYGHCSREYKAVVKSWQEVGLLTGVNLFSCYDIDIFGPDAVVGGPAVSFRLRPSVDYSVIPQGGTFSYNIPNGWNAYQDGNDLVVTGISGTASRKINVVYNDPNGVPHHGSKVVHIVQTPGTINAMLSELKKEEKEGSNDIAAIKLYPNPAKDVLKVALPYTLAEVPYTITNIQGQVVATGTLRSNDPSIAVAALPEGMYLFRIQSPQLNVNRKFVISRK